eukprot:1186727-Prorocentrum_minimum.AAC.1
MPKLILALFSISHLRLHVAHEAGVGDALDDGLGGVVGQAELLLQVLEVLALLLGHHTVLQRVLHVGLERLLRQALVHVRHVCRGEAEHVPELAQAQELRLVALNHDGGAHGQYSVKRIHTRAYGGFTPEPSIRPEQHPSIQSRISHAPIQVAGRKTARYYHV